MKQGTLFEAFSKSSTLNGKSDQLEPAGSVIQTIKFDGSTRTKEKCNNISLSTVLSQPGLVFDVNTATNKAKGLNLPVSDVKLEEINIQSENESNLLLMPSSQTGRKRNLKLAKKSSPPKLKIKNKMESESQAIKQTDISSINHEVLLNSLKHLQPQEIDRDMSIGSSGTETPSKVAGRKEVDSMEYEEFIAQLTDQNKQQTQNSSQTLKSSEVNKNYETKKHAMSYSEFLKMFKSPPKDDEFKLADGEQEAVAVLISVKNPEEIKCKSIASFFTKIEGNSRQIKISKSKNVRVVAEIHTPSQPTEELKTKIRYHGHKTLPGKAEEVCHISHDDKNDIEFLSTETITDKACVGKKTLTTKKRNNETAMQLFQISKKQKLASQSEIQEKQDMETADMSKLLKAEKSSEISKKQKVKRPSEVSVKQKVITQSDVSDKLSEIPLEMFEKHKKPHSEIYVKCEKEIINKTCSESTSTEEIEVVALTVASVMKTSQSTLGFGKSGLSLVKAIEPTKDNPVDKESCIDAKNTTKKISSRRSKTGKESGVQGNSHKDIDIVEDDCREQHDQHLKSQHKREHLGLCDPLILATGAHLSTQKGTKDEPATDLESVPHTAVESSGLRRSSRLTRSIQAVKELDVVEICSESEDEGLSSDAKKRGRKGETLKIFTASDKSAGSSTKKSSGNLAPIFTSVKSKEQTGRNIPQATDPEKDRLRREFLMSGIPEELKRQIATTVNSNVLLDYPPFPRINHVQQILDGTSLIAKLKIPKLCCILGDYESIPSTPLLWENLEWDLSEKSSNLHRNFLETLTTNLPLQDSQLDLLLKELQCSDDKFPFRKTYAHLHSKIDSIEASNCGSQVVTVEEDDDVVVIDSSPVSERLMLKHASEPRAFLWSELHQPESSEHIIGNARAIKQLKSWLEEWKVLVEKQVRKASKISNSVSKNKNTGGWSDDSDFIDSEEEEMTLCNSVLITGPHGVGKTASVYALAKELGYKIFEVNSSSLRSGKQLLAQLEEATQSHRVAQNKTKSFLHLDSPTAGTFSNRKEETSKGIKCTPKSKPVSAISNAHANLFRLATPVTQDSKSQLSQSGTKVKENKSKFSMQESSIRGGTSKKRSLQPTDLEMTESIPAKSDKRKNLVEKEEISTTKIKKHKSKETSDAVPKKQKGHQLKTGMVDVASQTSTDCNMTSGSLNLTSASLILFDEVDVVFEEDKGFLSTVQHFMMSTKIPIVLTSTDVSFHHHLQARHEHIKLQPPPLISAASFLSTLCLAHGVRISHQSVLNAIHYMNGDIRRCLLYLQYWCESGGGLVQVAKEVDPKSWSASVKNSGRGDVAEKLMKDFHSVTSSGSRMIYNDDSDFISLRPPKKKARRMVSDEESSQDATSISENELTIAKSTILQKDLSLGKKKSKQVKVMLNGVENVTVENEFDKQINNLLSLHIRFEESLLGLHGCDVSTATILDFIKSPNLNGHGLNHAVHACSTISQALNIDTIYHVVLHGLPLPKSDILKTLLILPTKQEAAPPGMAYTISRKRIIQGDWLDSDSSNEAFDQVNSVAQDTTKDDDNCHGIDAHASVKAGKEFSEKFSKMYDAEGVSTERCSKLMAPVLSDFSRFYDNMSCIDYLESWPRSSISHLGGGVKLTPGLSDEETHSEVSYHGHEDWLHLIGGHVEVLAARKFSSSIHEHVNNFKTCAGGHINCEDTQSASVCTEYGSQTDLCNPVSWPVEFHLPVQKMLPDLWSIADKMQSQSLSSEPAYKNVSKCLGPTVRVSDPSLHLDYMPYLRDICRLEDQRRVAKSQRRFHHYLDNIGLGLKESTIASLTSMYAVSSDSQFSQRELTVNHK